MLQPLIQLNSDQRLLITFKTRGLVSVFFMFLLQYTFVFNNHLIEEC